LFTPTGLCQNILENNKQRGFNGILFHAFPKAAAQGMSILEKLKTYINLIGKECHNCKHIFKT